VHCIVDSLTNILVCNLKDVVPQPGIVRHCGKCKNVFIVKANSAVLAIANCLTLSHLKKYITWILPHCWQVRLLQWQPDNRFSTLL